MSVALKQIALVAALSVALLAPADAQLPSLTPDRDAAIRAIDTITPDEWLNGDIEELVTRVRTEVSVNSVRAAAETDPRAMFLLAWVLSTREEDEPEQFRLTLAAADAGLAWAQHDVAYRYFYGDGVTQDANRGVPYLRAAAEQGLAEAQSRLGELYAWEWNPGGLTLAQDDVEAVRLYRMAADQNDGYGTYRLATMYEQGRGGLPQDHAEAVRLLRYAATDLDAGNASYELQRMGEPLEEPAAASATTPAPYETSAGGSWLNGCWQAVSSTATFEQRGRRIGDVRRFWVSNGLLTETTDSGDLYLQTGQADDLYVVVLAQGVPMPDGRAGGGLIIDQETFYNNAGTLMSTFIRQAPFPGEPADGTVWYQRCDFQTETQLAARSSSAYPDGGWPVDVSVSFDGSLYFLAITGTNPVLPEAVAPGGVATLFRFYAAERNSDGSLILMPSFGGQAMGTFRTGEYLNISVQSARELIERAAPLDIRVCLGNPEIGCVPSVNLADAIADSLGGNAIGETIVGGWDGLWYPNGVDGEQLAISFSSDGRYTLSDRDGTSYGSWSQQGAEFTMTGDNGAPWEGRIANGQISGVSIVAGAIRIDFQMSRVSY